MSGVDRLLVGFLCQVVLSHLLKEYAQIEGCSESSLRVPQRNHPLVCFLCQVILALSTKDGTPVECCPRFNFSGSPLMCILPYRTLRLAGGHSVDALPPTRAGPGEDSEPRPKVPQLTEDGDCGDLSDDRYCNTYPEQCERSASLPEYAGQSRAGYHSPMGIQSKADFGEDFLKQKAPIEPGSPHRETERSSSGLRNVGSECRQRFLHMPLHAKLRGEDVPHHALTVYDVRHPTGEETEGLGHPV
jgi:hypothetical protein